MTAFFFSNTKYEDEVFSPSQPPNQLDLQTPLHPN